MFSVTLKDKNEKIYYVFNKGELYQPLIPIGAFFSINPDKYEIEDIKVLKNNVVIIIKNKTPVIISAEDYQTFIKNTTGVLSNWEEAPTTEITDKVYYMLYRLYQSQYQETEEYQKNMKIQEDISTAENLLSKQKGPYRTF